MKDIFARELKGHNILAVERFRDETRWMIEFSVKKPESTYGVPGDEMRLFLTEEDYRKACQIVMQQLSAPLAKDEAFVLMGHGTEHYANSAYCQFENMLRDLGHENTYVGTVEGFPGLDYVIRRMKIRGIRKVYLMPLMIVAGDHARNDLAGAEADSWDSLLRAEGFETEIFLKGMGEIDGIADLFVEHLQAAEEI